MPALLKSIEVEPDVNVRVVVVKALAGIGGPEAQATLARLARKDKDKKVRKVAAEALVEVVTNDAARRDALERKLNRIDSKYKKGEKKKGAAGLGGAKGRKTAAPAPRSGAQVVVTTTPPGARVTIDERTTRHSPAVFTGLKSGTHLMMVQKRGYITQTRTFKVEQKSSPEIKIVLAKGVPLALRCNVLGIGNSGSGVYTGHLARNRWFQPVRPLVRGQLSAPPGLRRIPGLQVKRIHRATQVGWVQSREGAPPPGANVSLSRFRRAAIRGAP